MRKFVLALLAVLGAAALATLALAQPPGGKPADDKDKKDYSNAPLVTRIKAWSLVPGSPASVKIANTEAPAWPL